jgi:hypothetical protein
MSELLLDRAGRRRSPATLPGFHAGHAPGNKGLRYPADPPKVEEIIRRDAYRRRRSARPAATGTDRDHVARGPAHPGGASPCRGRSRSSPRLASRSARQGRAPSRGRHGLLGLGTLQPWHEMRRELPVGPLLCVINGTTRGRHWSPAAARAELRRTAAAAGVRRRFAPPPAQARPRRRDGARRRTTDRYPAPTWTQQPRHHLRLPARNRQRRDHRHRARPTRANDPRQRFPAALINREGERCSSRIATHRSESPRPLPTGECSGGDLRHARLRSVGRARNVVRRACPEP